MSGLLFALNAVPRAMDAPFAVAISCLPDDVSFLDAIIHLPPLCLSMFKNFDSTAISHVIRFLLSFFASFTDFEGEYSLYLTEKCVKIAEKDSEKMVAGVIAVESY
jgi:2-keto-4-pentenoate hydratase/2-oxohepta-3-ene-1,7-dioic acid hydratase in catechol pathway